MRKFVGVDSATFSLSAKESNKVFEIKLLREIIESFCEVVEWALENFILASK